MVKSWEEHKAEMKKDDAAENRKVLVFCSAVFGLLVFALAIPALLK